MAPHPPVLTRGDRFMNFALPDSEGLARFFYLEVSGGPVVLFGCASLRDDEARAAVTSLQAAQQSLAIADLDLFVISADTPAIAFPFAAELGLGQRCLCDPKGEVLSQLLAPLGDGTQNLPRFGTLVLDANQRLLAGLIAKAAQDQGTALVDLLKSEPAPDTDKYRLGATAPVMMLPNVFEADLCQRLIEVWASEHQEGSVSDGTKNVYAPETKRNLEHVISDPALRREITQRLARRIGPELVKVYHFNQPYRFEAYTILSYQADRQDFFGRHRDNVRETRQRRFAVSLNLNDDFEGGDLFFPEYPPHKFGPPAGGALIFSGNILHEAHPVTRGQRWALTTFLCDPDQPSPQ